jgi:hypothetical protein
VLGRRRQPRPVTSDDDASPAAAGGTATSSGCNPRVTSSGGTGDPPEQEHVEPATVWHPPGNEDEAMWKELMLLVEGLGEENSKWANCLSRIARRLEASHTSCRKQRDMLLEAAIPRARPNGMDSEQALIPSCHEASLTSEKLLGDSGKAMKDDEVMSHMTKQWKAVEGGREDAQREPAQIEANDREVAEDKIIFAGYGRAVISTTSAAAESAFATSEGPPSATQAQSIRTEDAGQTACDANAPAESSSNASAQPKIPPPHRSPQPPLVPSVQISLLHDRADQRASALETGIYASNEEDIGPTSSTECSSAEEEYDDGKAKISNGKGGALTEPTTSTLLLSSTNRMRENFSDLIAGAERLGTHIGLTSERAPQAEHQSAPEKSPREHLENGNAPQKGSAQNAIATGATQSAANLSGTGSLTAANTSGVVWPPATLYTPRSTVASMHTGSGEAGDRHEVTDGLSRSATSLLPNTYTPRSKPTTRLGMAPMRNQTASRAGSLRYPPSGMARPFGVQRMASGTLAQVSSPPSAHTVAPSPRQKPVVAASAASSKHVGVRAPSVSTSPRRDLRNQMSMQFPVASRPASAMAPTAVNPSSGIDLHDARYGVSRQSSCEHVPQRPSARQQMSADMLSMPSLIPIGLGGDAARLPSAARAGSGSAAGSASGPIGGGGASSAAARATNASSGIPNYGGTNGLAAYNNSKGAPPPQTQMPVSAKGGYSSIQLWTAHSQRQATGVDAKQASAARDREISVEPPQVGRSPSANLALSPRAYPSVGMQSASGLHSSSAAVMSKFAAWRS